MAQFRLMPIGVFAAVLAGGCTVGARNLQDLIKEVGEPVVAGRLTVTPIMFHPEDHRAVEAERGHLSVPVNRDRPDAGEIKLHFVRLPTKAERPRAPIVYLAGGPGGSGTASLGGDRFPLFDKLRDVADVIGFDQRGTWNTEPYMVCPGSWNLSLDAPLTAELIEAGIAAWVHECHRHWSDKGVDLDAFNTRESARDLEDLRIALGADKLNLLAISYGTHLALEFARSFPESLERLVLAGTEGPDHSLKSPDDIAVVLQRLDDYFRSNGLPAVTTRAERVLNDLSRGDVRTRVIDPQSGDELEISLGVEDARIILFANIDERDDMEELNAGLDLAVAGEYGSLAQAAYDWRTANRGLAMSLAMDCSSWASDRRLDEIRSAASRALLGDVPNLLIRAQCAAWPGSRLDDGFRLPITSNAPTLFVSGLLDVRTPVENAREVARGFSNAWHLEIEDGGHDDDLLIGTDQIGAIIKAFLGGRNPAAPQTRIRIGS